MYSLLLFLFALTLVSQILQSRALSHERTL